jgi:hypothetical protein
MGMCIGEENMAPMKGIEPHSRECKDYSVENNIYVHGKDQDIQYSSNKYLPNWSISMFTKTAYSYRLYEYTHHLCVEAI